MLRPALAALALAAALGPAAPHKAKKPKPAPKGPLPVVSLVELEVRARAGDGRPAIDKQVRAAHPQGWTGDLEPDGRSVRLFGPEGEGELLIAAVTHPSELTEHLAGLRERHPGAVPSSPRAMEISGVDPQKGERATRFVITGREVGEIVMIERGGAIVIYAAVVQPTAWEALRAILERCYPTVEVADRGG